MRPIRRYRLGLAESMGLDPGVVDSAGTSIAATEDRAGSGIASCYQLGEHTVVWTEPDCRHHAVDLASADRATSDSEWRRWAAEQGHEILGQAVMKVLDGRVLAVDPPSGYSLVVFDWERPEHRRLMDGFVARSDPDDLDAAEIDLDALDAHAVGLLDSGGAIAAYASMRESDLCARFGDIGVMVDPSHRKYRLGVAVVSALILRACPEGWDPLYRCDPENLGSDRLSARLGFIPATTLTAARFAPGGE